MQELLLVIVGVMFGYAFGELRGMQGSDDTITRLRKDVKFWRDIVEKQRNQMAPKGAEYIFKGDQDK